MSSGTGRPARAPRRHPLATGVAFYRVDWRAGALLVPYLAWVSFAGYLDHASGR